MVFVADSQVERAEANLASMPNLYDHMAAYGYDVTSTPFVIQCHKRDLPNAAPVADPFATQELLVRQLPTGVWVERVPTFEAVAVTGDGVFDTLKAVSKLVLKTLA